MNRTVSFRKMEGAGNDFIFLHDPDCPHTPGLIARLCDRRRGIGGDGMIFLTPEAETVRFEYFNADGSPAEMCGNGLRCAMEYACLEGIVEGKTAQFRTDSGILPAERLVPELIRIGMPEPEPFREVCHGIYRMHLTKVGVPHAVVETDDLENADVDAVGRELRFASELGADGANVDFIRIVNENTAVLRTYERGVEGETLACGTGVTASAAWLFASRGGKTEKNILCRGGDTLTVTFEQGKSPRLTGPAKSVFAGTFELKQQNP